MKLGLTYIVCSIYLLGLTACSNGLPSCDSNEAKKRVEKLYNDNALSDKFLKLDSITEFSYNPADHRVDERRICKGTIKTPTGFQKIYYIFVKDWRNEKAEYDFGITLDLQ